MDAGGEAPFPGATGDVQEYKNAAPELLLEEVVRLR